MVALSGDLFKKDNSNAIKHYLYNISTIFQKTIHDGAVSERENECISSKNSNVPK